MKRKPLTKKAIFELIDMQIEDSFVLKGKTPKGVWTINELVFCLEMLQRETHTLFNINMENGTYIPVEDGVPTFIDCKTRAQKVKIIDIEAQSLWNDECGDPYVYLIIIKEVE